jgi:F-type H+-transporting ATPase subunit epsilon
MAEPTAPMLQVVVVTPEKAALNTTAELVVLPMYDGELGVLPNRAPLIGRLGTGELRLKTGTSTRRYFVEAGFVQVRSNVVTVLTAKACPAAEVTVASAEAALAEAAALPAGNAVELDRKNRARERAAGMMRVATRNSLTS